MPQRSLLDLTRPDEKEGRYLPKRKMEFGIKVYTKLLMEELPGLYFQTDYPLALQQSGSNLLTAQHF